MPSKEEQTTVKGIVKGVLNSIGFVLGSLFVTTTIALICLGWWGFAFGKRVDFNTCLTIGFVWTVLATLRRSLRGKDVK